MRDWELEAALSNLTPFVAESAKYELEQYSTSAHLAAQIVLCAERSFGDIEGKRVLDLGCGTAILSCAAMFVGATSCVGVEIDDDALALARENVARCECAADVDLVRADVRALPLAVGACADTCVMNPPFGTRDKGVDALFVRAALSRVSGAVYSLHKSATRDYFLARAGDWGATAAVVAELKFDLPKMYAFHRDANRDVAVDLLRFVKLDPDAPPVTKNPRPPPPPEPPRGRGRGGRSRGRGRGTKRR